MKLSDRKTAAVICALMIALSIFLGGKISLGRLRSDIVELFYEGDSSVATDFGIQYDLDKRISYAKNLVVVAGRYMDEGSKLIKNVIEAYEELEETGKTENVKKKYKANENLTEACNALYEHLKTLSLSAKDAEYNEGIKANMDSANTVISHAVYNSKAKEFNELLGRFPTNFVKLFSGTRKLELFDY